MKEIFSFLRHPSKSTEILISKSQSDKIKIITSLLLLYSLTSVGSLYFGMMGGMLDALFFIKSFLYSIFFGILFVGIVFYIGKLFGGKGKYIDMLLITAVANITFIIFSIIQILLNIAGLLAIVLLIGGVLGFITSIWFLVIWSKGLSKTEQFSETRVTITVVLALIIYYFLNIFLMGMMGLSLM